MRKRQTRLINGTFKNTVLPLQITTRKVSIWILNHFYRALNGHPAPIIE